MCFGHIPMQVAQKLKKRKKSANNIVETFINFEKSQKK